LFEHFQIALEKAAQVEAYGLAQHLHADLADGLGGKPLRCRAQPRGSVRALADQVIARASARSMRPGRVPPAGALPVLAEGGDGVGIRTSSADSATGTRARQQGVEGGMRDGAGIDG